MATFDGLAPGPDELLPLASEAPLGSPGHLADARVLADLAAAQLVRDHRPAPGVLGRLDEQAARVLGSGLGDRAWRRRSSEVRSDKPRSTPRWLETTLPREALAKL